MIKCKKLKGGVSQRMNTDKNIDNGMIDKLKKATTELIILSLLEKENLHIGALTEKMEEYSNGKCKIVFPYAAIYRLIDAEYIYECGKKVEDGRRRQFLSITDKGVQYLSQIREQYDNFIQGVNCIFERLNNQEDI